MLFRNSAWPLLALQPVAPELAVRKISISSVEGAPYFGSELPQALTSALAKAASEARGNAAEIDFIRRAGAPGEAR